MRIVAVCGSYHKEEVEKMLEFARDEASMMNSELTDVVWVPGSMEAPLALERLLLREDVEWCDYPGYNRAWRDSTWVSYGAIRYPCNNRPTNQA